MTSVWLRVWKVQGLKIGQFFYNLSNLIQSSVFQKKVTYRGNSGEIPVWKKLLNPSDQLKKKIVRVLEKKISQDYSDILSQMDNMQMYIVWEITFLCQERVIKVLKVTLFGCGWRRSHKTKKNHSLKFSVSFWSVFPPGI